MCQPRAHEGTIRRLCHYCLQWLKFALTRRALIQVNESQRHPDARFTRKAGGCVMADFIIEVLSRDQIRSVYPLVREAVPTLDLAAWLRFARQLTGPRRAGQCGIVVARREGRPFPCGLFCYRVEDDLKLGKVLVADHFVAVDLLEPAAVLAALVEQLDSLGKRLGCRAVRSLVHGGARELEGGLYAAGHRPDSASLLLKTLLEAPPGGGGGTRRDPERAPAIIG
jgi:hypothetical protein